MGIRQQFSPIVSWLILNCAIHIVGLVGSRSFVRRRASVSGHLFLSHRLRCSLCFCQKFWPASVRQERVAALARFPYRVTPTRGRGHHFFTNGRGPPFRQYPRDVGSRKV
jgi:hypothetical protein